VRILGRKIPSASSFPPEKEPEVKILAPVPISASGLSNGKRKEIDLMVLKTLHWISIINIKTGKPESLSQIVSDYKLTTGVSIMELDDEYGSKA
jgi:hypothetical protein